MIQHPRIETEKAAALLRAGKLVAFPTETVYGLGANALDDKAVASIYAAKNRPDFNPLITHVVGMEDAFSYGEYDLRAEQLMDVFWPGALTIILPRRKKCALSLLVSAGLDSVALRAPSHPLAQALLKRSGLPIAAPSANLSGRVSPTTAEHVEEELGDKVSMILDGGPCFVGIESTVLDLSSSEVPTLLRHGRITREKIEKIIGTIQLVGDGKIKSPGMLESHYAPNAKLRLNATHVEADEVLLAFGSSLPHRGRAGVGGGLHRPMEFTSGDSAHNAPLPTSPLRGEEYNLSEAGDLTEAAANLFAMLRALDKTGAKCIAISPIPMEGLGIAINDRLQRAAVR